MPNIASKIAQHRANIGQHRPNIGQPRPNIGSTWAQDAPSIDHMGPTWLNLGRRCAPDSFTLLHIGPTKANIGERERERRGRTCARRLSQLRRIPGIRPGGQPPSREGCYRGTVAYVGVCWPHVALCYPYVAPSWKVCRAFVGSMLAILGLCWRYVTQFMLTNIVRDTFFGFFLPSKRNP